MWNEVISLAVYQVGVLSSILYLSNKLLGLPYLWYSSAWVTPEVAKLDPSHTKKAGDPTNKTIVFTMVVHSYVLMQCANLYYLKTKDE